MGLLDKIALFFACLLLACLPLPQFAGEGGMGIGSLACLFILSSFANLFVVVAQNLKANGLKDGLQRLWEQLGNNLTKIDLAVFALILSAFVATASSYFLKESALGFAKYFLYFLVYLAFCSVIKDRQSVYILILASLIGLLWTSLEGIKQVMVGAEELATWEDPNIHPSQHLNRIYSTLLNPNLYSAYLLGLWPLCLLRLGFIKKKVPLKENLWQVFGLFFGLLALYLTVQTGSRGAWIALVVQFIILSIALFIYTRSRFLFMGLILGSVGAVLYVLTKPSFLNRVLSIFSSYDHSSNSFRLHVWKACLQMVTENPLFGIGTGSKAFYLAYGIYMDAKYSALGAYSLFIETAVEMGLIGLASLLALVFFIGQLGIQTVQRLLPTKDSSDRGKVDLIAVMALLLSLAGLLIDSFFDIVILRPQLQVILWMLVAMLRFYILNTKKSTDE